MRTYLVQWSGPFEQEDIPDKSFGLYLITGKEKGAHNPTIGYCGITTQNFRVRLGSQHHKARKITRERKYWIGEVFSNSKLNRSDLELVEGLIIYAQQLKLNERKKKRPTNPCLVISRWFNTNGAVRKRDHHIAQEIEDVIYWDGEFWHIADKMRIY